MIMTDTPIRITFAAALEQRQNEKGQGHYAYCKNSSLQKRQKQVVKQHDDLETIM